jgi:hypothetical protein
MSYLDFAYFTGPDDHLLQTQIYYWKAGHYRYATEDNNTFPCIYLFIIGIVVARGRDYILMELQSLTGPVFDS